MSEVKDMTDSELFAELKQLTKGKARSWNWIRKDHGKIYDVHYDGDSSLTAYETPTRTALETTVTILRRKAERRRKSAAKGAETRKRRHELKVDRIAKLFVNSGKLPPSIICHICRKTLSDKESINRGIGTECWQTVLQAVERERNKE